VDAAVSFPRPFRLDYLLLLWAAVPWIWARPRLLEPSEWRPLASELAAWARTQWREVRTADQPLRAGMSWVARQVRVLVGLDESRKVVTHDRDTVESTTAPPAPAG